MFARHPVGKELLEKKLEVHKDKTLRHATQDLGPQGEWRRGWGCNLCNAGDIMLV